jgi:hypothetical protein
VPLLLVLAARPGVVVLGRRASAQPPQLLLPLHLHLQGQPTLRPPVCQCLLRVRRQQQQQQRLPPARLLLRLPGRTLLQSTA